jgi:hypothetical protein
VPLRRHQVWLVVALLIALLIATLGFFGWRLAPYVRDRAVKALGDRLESEVQLATLRVTWSPRLGVAGEGLVIRHRGRTDVPPLIELKTFYADATITGLLARPMRLRTLHVTGLRIHIPPRSGKPEPEQTTDSKPEKDAKSDKQEQHDTDLTIDHLLAEDAELHILPKERDHPPRVFLIHRVQLESIGKQTQASFQATLTNPKPRGEIESTGNIGPWGRDEPSLTPVSGTYAFRHADLGTIHGIGGILDSTGKYGGPLERIEVEGETTTPDFSISTAGNPVPLQTKYQAVVDGTNGDTILKRVDATLGKSSMVAKGAIVDVKGADGRLIKVNVVMDNGRIEDMLRLAVKGDRPFMIGAIDLKTDLQIPPGEADVIDKLYLNGQFGLNRARFIVAGIQQKIEELSKRGRGKTDAQGEDESENVVSNMRGRFLLKNATLRFSRLEFEVPGAAVRLSGTYHLRRELIDLQGTLTLQAKISQTVAGYKSVLLKVFDPLFKRKNAGAVIPIKITGTRKDPKFGLDVKRALTRGD